MIAMITNAMHRLAMPLEKLSGESLSVSNISPNNTLNAGKERPVTKPPKVPKNMCM